MYDAKATAEQEWEVFKALCPKELMDIIESPDITTVQYKKIYNMLLSLGFYDSATLFLESKYALVQENRKKNNETDLLVFTNTAMRRNKYSDDYVQLFIDNVRNIHLQKHFENYSQKYSKMLTKCHTLGSVPNVWHFVNFFHSLLLPRYGVSGYIYLFCLFLRVRQS